MKVILTQDVRKLGQKFDEKEVNEGYARNFLIPNNLAVQAGSNAAKQVEELKAQRESQKVKSKEEAMKALSKIAGTTLTLKLKANEQGHLFEKLTSEKLAHIIKEEQGIELDYKTLRMEGPIKEVGTHEIPIEAGESTLKFTLEIIKT